MSDNNSQDRPSPGGRNVGRYQLLDEIGAGGMSRVYRGRLQGSQEPVAIKVIQVENMDEEFEARLRREPEVQKGLGHENIVRLIESFREHDEFFLVMEYVEGRSMARLIHEEAGPLQFDRARGYFRQVLRAVDHLHRLGIVHRDIKPSNILIRWDDAVKLADFGIAKFTWQGAQTKTQRGLGTPEYMSPEQARGKSIDPRTDIYSIGITLFEALTARKPFAREEDTPMAYVEVIQEILTKPLPDPRAFYPAISPDVVRLLNKATAKDPADRFQSCAEFLGALEIVDSSIAVPPIASPSAASSPTVVVPRTAAAAGARVSEPTVARSAGPAPTGTTGAARPVIRQEPPKRSAMPWILLALVVLCVGGYFGYQEYLKRSTGPVTHLNDADAMRISRSVAADTKQYQMSGNAGALASLFDEKNVEFFKLKRATRDQIRTDIAKLTSTIASTEQFDINVKRARALDDSTIESEWVIAYQRTKNDGSILRGSTSNLTRLHFTDGQWLITSQRENWTQRNNVPPPPKPKADSIAAIDSVKHPQTPSADDDR
ncbi:MAG: protein kinase, partial [Bacteroidota bacterium]